MTPYKSFPVVIIASCLMFLLLSMQDIVLMSFSVGVMYEIKCEQNYHCLTWAVGLALCHSECDREPGSPSSRTLPL